jgi:hypothetical protein
LKTLGVTVTDAVAEFLESCNEVAVIVTVPIVTPVTEPEALTVAMAVFEDVQVTAELKLPVPVTVAVHCDVAAGWMETGLQETIIGSMVGEEEGCEWAPQETSQTKALSKT